MKGYKVFNPEWTCRGFKFEVGKIYEEKINPKCCEQGFHFCKNIMDCFNYYAFDSQNKVAIVEALGEIDEQGTDSKCCTNRIHIINELTWQEVLDLVNVGNENLGFKNTGNRNTGNYNTGNRNTGNYNTGDCNTGWNNTGDCNTGDYNTGDYNLSNHETGCFCTEQHKIRIFDKETDITLTQWRDSQAYLLLSRVKHEPTRWIQSTAMTDKEKILNPKWEATGGYLRANDLTKAYQNWWNELTEDEKEIIQGIPNFDKNKFKNIVGIEV